MEGLGRPTPHEVRKRRNDADWWWENAGNKDDVCGSGYYESITPIWRWQQFWDSHAFAPPGINPTRDMGLFRHPAQHQTYSHYYKGSSSQRLYHTLHAKSSLL